LSSVRITASPPLVPAFRYTTVEAHSYGGTTGIVIVRVISSVDPADVVVIKDKSITRELADDAWRYTTCSANPPAATFPSDTPFKTDFDSWSPTRMVDASSSSPMGCRNTAS